MGRKGEKEREGRKKIGAEKNIYAYTHTHISPPIFKKCKLALECEHNLVYSAINQNVAAFTNSFHKQHYSAYLYRMFN